MKHKIAFTNISQTYSAVFFRTPLQFFLFYSTATKKASGKRTTIASNGDKRYVRRDGKGQFKESDDVGKSLSADVKQHAKTKSKPGYGDKGDR